MQVEGQTEEVIFDHLHATAFQYTPLGRTILGPAQNIKTITKDHLQSYIQTHYTAPRMVCKNLLTSSVFCSYTGILRIGEDVVFGLVLLDFALICKASSGNLC